MAARDDVVTMDKIVSLCRRRGFVFPSSEIYGGLGSGYDYGHYGVLLKQNIRDRWLEAMVQERDDIVVLDTAIILHPRVWEASGTRRWLQRPARRLPHLQAALPRGPARAVAVRQAPEQAARGAHRVRPDRATAVQPDVRDDGRAGAGVRREGLPPAGDGAGHLHQLQERAPARPAASAVRDRERRRQVVPKRDHPGQLPLPHARVRADGDGVLRPARRVDGVVPLLGAGARRLVPALRPARVAAARPRARRGGAVALLERDERPRVPVPDRLVGARGGREPRRLRPQRARRALRDEARVRRHGR